MPNATQRMARRKLSAKLRPLMLRRLKKQVAKDLPDRIEERRDCELGRLAAQALPRRTAPQPRAGHADRPGEGSRAQQNARARRSHPAAPDLLPPHARRQRFPQRQDRDAVRTDRTVAGRRTEGAGLQPVRPDAATPRNRVPAAPDAHPRPHRRNQEPAGCRPGFSGGYRPPPSSS